MQRFAVGRKKEITAFSISSSWVTGFSWCNCLGTHRYILVLSSSQALAWVLALRERHPSCVRELVSESEKTMVGKSSGVEEAFVEQQQQ
jgi:hypothetical protein